MYSIKSFSRYLENMLIFSYFYNIESEGRNHLSFTLAIIERQTFFECFILLNFIRYIQ